MSSGLTPAELVYMSQLCNSLWQYPSGSAGDQSYKLAKSVAMKIATGQISVPQAFEFADLQNTNPLDMGTF